MPTSRAQRTVLITTAINVPTKLRDYALHARDPGHDDGNLFRDRREEPPAMATNEALIEVCRRARFTGDNYLACYRELAEHT